MNFKIYQSLSARTINRDLSDRDQLANAGMGLAGEAGETADLIKKHLYHGHKLDRDRLLKEVGDVLWYLAGVCEAVGLSLDDAAEGNIAKLIRRYPEGFTVKDSIARADMAPAADPSHPMTQLQEKMKNDGPGKPRSCTAPLNDGGVCARIQTWDAEGRRWICPSGHQGLALSDLF